MTLLENKMHLWELSVQAPDEVVDSLMEIFGLYNGENGGGVVEVVGFDAVGERTDERNVVRTYVPAREGAAERIEKLRWAVRCLQHLYEFPPPQVRSLDEEDWALAWKASYKPLRLGRRVFVRPSWIENVEVGEGLIEVILDPGMAFGTGLHPTTRLALELLEETVRPGDVVWDIGTGSGILSIVAARLGASRVVATDVDRTAVEVARRNVSVNGVEGLVEVQHGSVPAGAGTPDVVVVNILAEVILRLLEEEHLGDYLHAGGRMILSGIIAHSAPMLRGRLGGFGLCIVRERQDGDWWAWLAEKQPIALPRKSLI